MRKGIILLVILLIACAPVQKVDNFETLVALSSTLDVIETDLVDLQKTLTPITATPEPTPTLDLIAINGEGQWVVGRVLDGDSLHIYEDIPENDSIETITLTFQLAGIDAPELDECAGKQAWEALRLLIAGKHVDIELVFQSPDWSAGYVYYRGVDVGRIMVERGWAIGLDDIRYEPYQSWDGINSICIGDPTPDATVAVSHCIGWLFDSCWDMEVAGCAPAYMTDTWYEDEHDLNGDYIACGEGD